MNIIKNFGNIEATKTINMAIASNTFSGKFSLKLHVVEDCQWI